LHRLNIFAKGNLDLRDTLYALKSGGETLWNGINGLVRAQFPWQSMRVQHELWTRSDALLQSDGTIPKELAERNLPLEPYMVETQFSQAVFEANADVYVLSLQPDVATSLVRHKRDDYLFYPHEWRRWSEPDRLWLRDNFTKLPLLDVKTSMENLSRIVARIRQRTAAPILVYNLSAVVPGEAIHCHSGLDEIFSTRIRRFNLALVELSRESAISVIDVDGIIARGGADRLKFDAMHLTADGCRLVAEEVVRVLADHGCFTPSEQR
jgi:hypothetical protein